MIRPLRTLTNMLTQMEEHGPPNRIDRSFLSSMAGAAQSQFIHGLKKADVQVDRKVLAAIAANDAATFAKIADVAKAQLN